MKRGAKPRDDKWWPFLLMMEHLCQQGMKPHAAAVRIKEDQKLHRLPVHGSSDSAVKTLERMHRKHLEELRLELSGGGDPEWLENLRRWPLALQQIGDVARSTGERLIADCQRIGDAWTMAEARWRAIWAGKRRKPK